VSVNRHRVRWISHLNQQRRARLVAHVDAAAVDAAFFPDGQWRSLLVVNLGYCVTECLPPRGPRLEFEQAAAIV
jgi:hypothetical protein